MLEKNAEEVGSTIRGKNEEEERLLGCGKASEREKKEWKRERKREHWEREFEEFRRFRKQEEAEVNYKYVSVNAKN